MLPLFTRQSKPSKRESYFSHQFEQAAVKFELPAESELSAQLRMIHLTLDDLKRMKALQPLVEENMEVLADAFYSNIIKQPNLNEIIETHSSVERLKETLKQHILEMFNGEIDQAFLQKRLQIAQAHVRIGLQTKWYVSAFQQLTDSLIQLLEQHLQSPSDIVLATRSLIKLLNLEQQLVLEAYENENKRIEAEHERQKRELIQHLTAAAQELAAISQQTSAANKQLVHRSETVVASANEGTDLAIKAETLSLNGKAQITTQSSNMDAILQSVKHIQTISTDLNDRSIEITEFVDVVKGIADQTNLLALNATIEASRAGEKGKGFAVVANEVRKLADQTKDSTNTVSQLIEKTTEQIASVVDSIGTIYQLVSEGSKGMDSTAGTFHSITEAMNEVKTKNEQMKTDLQQLLSVTKELDESSLQVSQSANQLNRLTTEVESGG
ncbi:globin-coupled sensor protein [Halalkalibacterium halodurans]|jgi:heme-based aerotactic transducer|uniref:Methyl-accepting transducer domain-containing protein n=2 Tax=Halalkalibacterium halodurans TaxID=86665 RepID=A0A0M0KDZ5_ALKHA|nr:globin-coupled sensor protein [Halalkalibacterium halodurans]TES54428.1 globin-coupled sensor protein [Halalkalibacterium halodurans]TPE69815.1 globin-coupled sensor protein [Halalkalibacterium halodurans]